MGIPWIGRGVLMKTLKQLLSVLVKKEGIFLEMQEGALPSLHQSEGVIDSLEAFPACTAEWIRGCISQILPKEIASYDAGIMIEGSLVVKQVGTLIVLAGFRPKPAMVVFMPSFASEKDRYRTRWLRDLEVGLPDSFSHLIPPPPLAPQSHMAGATAGPSFDTMESPIPVSGPIPDLFAREMAAPPPPPLKTSPVQYGEPEMEPDLTEVVVMPKVAAPPMAPPAFVSSAREVAGEPIDFSPVLTSAASQSQGGNPIDRYLQEMVALHASDLHLTTGQPLAFRKNGDIQKRMDVIVSDTMMRAFLDCIVPPLQRKRFSDTWDVDFAYEVIGLGRFRVNMFRDQAGVGAVMRHISERIPTLAELGLPAPVAKFATLSKGLVLVTGPTGSGKSTTLAALIESVNATKPLHILTIEDPIEFSYTSKKALIRQREVGKHTQSFPSALRACLREDPDIILIGELRDMETTEIAIETAETGHLVFGTVHTNSAVSSINRVVDQFPSERQSMIRSMLAASLKGVVTQTLVKKVDGNRCAAVELLVSDDAVAAMIREGKTHMIENHMQIQKAGGNQLLNEALLDFMARGVITSEEAWQNSVDRKSLEEMAKRKNLSFSGR